MRSSGRLKILLTLCVLGSLVGAVGAACISSGSNELEDLGLAIHRGGLLVMLVGFCGLLMRRGTSRGQTKKGFQWTLEGLHVVVKAGSAKEMLTFSGESAGVTSKCTEPLAIKNLSKQSKEAIRFVRLENVEPTKEMMVQLATLKNLCVVDLKACSQLSTESIRELERLEQIECLLLPPGLDSLALKRLRISLPEALFHEGDFTLLIV